MSENTLFSALRFNVFCSNRNVIACGICTRLNLAEMCEDVDVGPGRVKSLHQHTAYYQHRRQVSEETHWATRTTQATTTTTTTTVSQSFLNGTSPYPTTVSNVSHVLHTALPPPSTASQHYDLRRRSHTLSLPDHATYLSDCNFITRMLYKHCY